jgi:hypothetical protein
MEVLGGSVGGFYKHFRPPAARPQRPLWLVYTVIKQGLLPYFVRFLLYKQAFFCILRKKHEGCRKCWKSVESTAGNTN